MKKIVVLLAAVALAGISQAATMTWSITNMQAMNVEAGWLVAIYNADDTFDYAKAKDGTLTALYTGTATQSGTLIRATASGLLDTRTDPAAPFAYGDDVHGSISAYAVVFNDATIDGATEYIVSDAKSVAVKSNGANITLSFGSMAATTTSNAFLGSTWESTGGSSEDPSGVPEPTSGLLMLVGLGALALRRRR